MYIQYNGHAASRQVCQIEVLATTSELHNPHAGLQFTPLEPQTSPPFRPQPLSIGPFATAKLTKKHQKSDCEGFSRACRVQVSSNDDCLTCLGAVETFFTVQIPCWPLGLVADSLCRTAFSFRPASRAAVEV
jgi:hypothetical protein